MQSPPFPRYLVTPRSKYSPQRLVLKHPQLPFLPQCQRPSARYNTVPKSGSKCVLCSIQRILAGPSPPFFRFAQPLLIQSRPGASTCLENGKCLCQETPYSFWYLQHKEEIRQQLSQYTCEYAALFCLYCLCPFVSYGRDSADSIATRYGLHVPRIESRWGMCFFRTPYRPVLKPTQPPVRPVPGHSRG